MPESGARLQGGAARDPPRDRAGHDAYRYGRDVWCGAGRGAARRGDPRHRARTAFHRHEGAAEQRKLSRDARRRRTEPGAAGLRVRRLSTCCIGPARIRSKKTMRAFETLVAQGKARFVGVSNFEADAMLEAASYLRKTPLACNQVLYHLCERGIEHEVSPQLAARGSPWSPTRPLAAAAFCAPPGIARRSSASPANTVQPCGRSRSHF